MLVDILRLLREYDGCFRFWMGPRLFVLFSKPEHAEVFFQHPALLDKDENYYYITKALGEGLFTANGKLNWRVAK